MNQKNKIAIIGYKGYVGKAYVDFFKDHYDLVLMDKDDSNWDEVGRCVLAVVCVPTPMTVDGSCDISIVESIIEKTQIPMLIKSTIKPGTTDFLKNKYGRRIVFSPEYIGEGKYWTSFTFHQNAKDTPFVVLGGDQKDREYVLDLIVPIIGPQKRYIQMTALEAELVKYFENTYFGVKITFAQEMYDICKIFGADYYAVREGWAADPRVDPMHTMVFPKARGFSGKCLPKDLNGLLKAAKEKGYTPIMFEAMLESNKKIREKEELPLDY